MLDGYYRSGVLLVAENPTSVVAGNDAAVIVLQDTGTNQHVRRSFEQVVQVYPASGGHVELAFYVARLVDLRRLFAAEIGLQVFDGFSFIGHILS